MGRTLSYNTAYRKFRDADVRLDGRNGRKIRYTIEAYQGDTQPPHFRAVCKEQFGLDAKEMIGIRDGVALSLSRLASEFEKLLRDEPTSQYEDITIVRVRSEANVPIVPTRDFNVRHRNQSVVYITLEVDAGRRILQLGKIVAHYNRHGKARGDVTVGSARVNPDDELTGTAVVDASADTERRVNKLGRILKTLGEQLHKCLLPDRIEQTLAATDNIEEPKELANVLSVIAKLKPATKKRTKP